MSYVLPLITGLVVGIIFSLLKLPIPAPPAFQGILGIVGIWAGFALVGLFK